MTRHKIYCHICNKAMRQYNCEASEDHCLVHYFTCDSKWCPIDDYQIKVTQSPKKQEDGSYLSTIRV